jgi:hypothetical protein
MESDTTAISPLLPSPDSQTKRGPLSSSLSALPNKVYTYYVNDNKYSSTLMQGDQYEGVSKQDEEIADANTEQLSKPIPSDANWGTICKQLNKKLPDVSTLSYSHMLLSIHLFEYLSVIQI